MPEKLVLQGKEYLIECSPRKFLKPSVVNYNNRLTVYLSENSRETHKSTLLIWLKNVARKHIESRVRHYSEKYSFEYRRISIKDQSTRWGSCSSLKNLNFNWRLILAPKEVLDYVVVHELAHTKQMNHSINFWNIVSEVMPEYKSHRAWLKKHGGNLMKAI